MTNPTCELCGGTLWITVEPGLNAKAPCPRCPAPQSFNDFVQSFVDSVEKPKAKARLVFNGQSFEGDSIEIRNNRVFVDGVDSGPAPKGIQMTGDAKITVGPDDGSAVRHVIYGSKQE